MYIEWNLISRGINYISMKTTYKTTFVSFEFMFTLEFTTNINNNSNLHC